MLIVSKVYKYTDSGEVKSIHSLPPASALFPSLRSGGCKPIPVVRHLKTTVCLHIDWQREIWLHEVWRMMLLPARLQCIFVCFPQKKQFNHKRFTALIRVGGSVLEALARLSQQIHGFIYLYFIKSAFNGPRVIESRIS